MNIFFIFSSTQYSYMEFRLIHFITSSNIFFIKILFLLLIHKDLNKKLKIIFKPLKYLKIQKGIQLEITFIDLNK